MRLYWNSKNGDASVAEYMIQIMKKCQKLNTEIHQSVRNVNLFDHGVNQEDAVFTYSPHIPTPTIRAELVFFVPMCCVVHISSFCANFSRMCVSSTLQTTF